jgi:hypothetical protein
MAQTVPDGLPSIVFEIARFHASRLLLFQR